MLNDYLLVHLKEQGTQTYKTTLRISWFSCFKFLLPTESNDPLNIFLSSKNLVLKWASLSFFSLMLRRASEDVKAEKREIDDKHARQCGLSPSHSSGCNRFEEATDHPDSWT